MDISRIQNHPAGVALATRYDKSKDREGEFDKFVAVSVALTGFSDAELYSTGLVRAYFEEMALTVGRTIRGDFLEGNVGNPAAVLEPSNKWHPLAQNLIRMWYVGQWKALGDWAATQFGEAGADGRKQVPKGYNEFGRDITRVISPAGYQEGLAWRAMGGNPMHRLKVQSVELMRIEIGDGRTCAPPFWFMMS